MYALSFSISQWASRMSFGCHPQVLNAVFKALKINDVDVTECANDVGNAGVYLKDFADGQ